MSEGYLMVAILVMGLTTLALRLLPFLCLGHLGNHPLLSWVAKYLPPVAMPILVLFCLQSVSFSTPPYGLPEFIALSCLVEIHLWRRSMLLSLTLAMSLYLLLSFYLRM